jgi:23S rRNA (guanosine2251-2'-O)-methyltransferase
MSHIYGIGPVLEALRAGNRRFEKIIVADGTEHKRLGELTEQARRRGIQVRREPRSALDRICGTASHQGVVAVTSSIGYADADELIACASAATLFVLLDGIEDPHNLGAIIRTAECAGAAAVVVPERRAAHVTDTVVKTSAGATEHLPVAKVPNLPTFIEELKRNRFWVVGLDPSAKLSYTDYDYSGPTALVFGAEGHGLHRLVMEKCDVTVSIPMSGHIQSLNVSVAAGIVMFEAVRKRIQSAGKQ